MPYNANSLLTLGGLKTYAQKVKQEADTLASRVSALEGAGAQANVLEGVKVNGVALSIAEKMVDILIATGATNGTLSVSGTDVAIKGLAALAYKAQVSEADLDAALQAVVANVGTLVGTDSNKSVRTIANEELAKQLIPEDAQDSLDTLQEIADWIQDHPGEAAAMNTAIAKLQAIVDGIGDVDDDYQTVIAAIEGKISAAQASIYSAIKAGTTNGHLDVNGTDVTVYTHPNHTAHASGLYKVTVDTNGHVTAATPVEKSDITGLGIPGQDTTYQKATAQADGLMSKEHFTKLEGMNSSTDEEVQAVLDEVYPQTV